jgi:hypothetical protein
MLLVVRDSIEPVKNPLHNLHNYGILWLTTSSESLSNPAGLCWVQQSQPVDSIRSVRDTSPRRKGANSNAIHNTAEKKTRKKTKSPKCLSSCVAGCSQCSIHLHKACHSSVMFYRLEIVSKKFGMENFCEACSDRSNAVLFS